MVLDDLFLAALDRHLPVMVLWSKNGCPVWMALHPTDCIILSDVSTLCSECSFCVVCHAFGFYTHTIYMLKLLTAGGLSSL